MFDKPPWVLILAGPTGAGKTATAIAVAREWGAVVLSADAMQVYRGMDIGTAKASAAERALIPHEGIDIRDPDQSFDAAEFIALGDEVCRRFPRVIVAGGTSLYLQAFVRGLVATPPVDPQLRAEIEAIQDPHAELQKLDPQLAARLHVHDQLRIHRGIEVFRQTGRRLSELQAEHRKQADRIVSIGLWLDQDELGDQIDRRVHRMVEAGYVDEVRQLLDRGYAASLKPMQSLGYRHICQYLHGELSLEEAIRCTQRDTRTFARKQRNWMKSLGYPRTTDPIPMAMRAAEQLWNS